MGKGIRVAMFSAAGAFLVWNNVGSHEYRMGMMTVLDKIKSFFKRAKPPEAPREKLGKTTQP